MLTKREIVELVIENMSGGIQPDYRKYHPNVVSKYVDVALNSIIASDVKKSIEEGNNTLDSDWVKVFTSVPLRYDQIRGQVYIKFPKTVLLLQDNRGIREITWQQQGDARPFRIHDFTTYNVLANLECSQMIEGEYLALVEGERVYFPNMPVAFATINKAKVTVKAICTSIGYEDNEELPFPEERVFEIFSMVQQIMQNMRVKQAKVSNDSNPNTV